MELLCREVGGGGGGAGIFSLGFPVLVTYQVEKKNRKENVMNLNK